MSLADELKTLRTRVGLLPSPHVQVLRVEGPSAFEALDGLVPQRLFLQDAQVVPTLLLDADATIVADVQVGRDDEAYYLLCETRPSVSAFDLVRSRLAQVDGVTVHDLASSHEVYSVHGPWAWELLGEALGQEVIGQPYLSLQHVAQVTCFRGGKTGEYGYDLLMPRASVEATLQRLREVGAHYELGPLSLEAVDRAALENWFYCVRFAALWPFTPLELQLQWRLWHEKHGYVGAAAIAALRARGVERRLTVVHVAGAVVAGEQVTLDGERVGEVLMSAPREGAGELAWAMLAAPYAVAGLSVQVGAHAGRTVSPPTVMNQSLGLDPNKHSFRYGRVP